MSTLFDLSRRVARSQPNANAICRCEKSVWYTLHRIVVANRVEHQLRTGNTITTVVRIKTDLCLKQVVHNLLVGSYWVTVWYHSNWRHSLCRAARTRTGLERPVIVIKYGHDIENLGKVILQEHRNVYGRICWWSQLYWGHVKLPLVIRQTVHPFILSFSQLDAFTTRGGNCSAEVFVAQTTDESGWHCVFVPIQSHSLEPNHPLAHSLTHPPTHSFRWNLHSARTPFRCELQREWQHERSGKPREYRHMEEPR